MQVGQPETSTHPPPASYTDWVEAPPGFRTDPYAGADDADIYAAQPPVVAGTYASAAQLQAATRTWRRIGAGLGGAGAFAGYAGGVIALALHKRAQVLPGNATDFVTQAQNQYAQCYNGTGSWDDIDAACKRTLAVVVPGVSCAWTKLWYMADRVPQACVTGLSQIDEAARYHGQRQGALNWLCLLLALPVVAVAGGVLGALIGHYGRRALGTCTGSRAGALRGA